MLAGVSICSPLALGFDCKVSGLTSCAPSPTGMCKSSSESTRKASTHAIIGLSFPIIAIIVHSWAAAGLNLRAADYGTMMLRDKANSMSARDAFVDCTRAATVSIRALLSKYWLLLPLLEHLFVIIRKHSTATWICIYCANQARATGSDHQARSIHPVPSQLHPYRHRQNRSS